MSKHLDQLQSSVNAGEQSGHKCQICGSGVTASCELPGVMTGAESGPSRQEVSTLNPLAISPVSLTYLIFIPVGCLLFSFEKM